MRAWQQWAVRSQRGISRATTPRALGLSMHGGGGRVRRFSSVSKYPTNAEIASQDLADRDASHLVCGKCSSPISKTEDLVFFKWRSGIHVSCMTQAPLQRMRTEDHWNHADNEWKKHKLHCIKCDHAVGSIVRVFNSDKILFSAKEVAIQMPEHQSPMISLSGYPSSILGFTMWSELLLMLESQPNLKAQLQIRRVDNVRDFNVEKKEINTLLLLASDLKALLDVVEKHSTQMNHVNLMTALHRASVLVAAKKKLAPLNSKPRFSVRSEAPEDDLMNLPVHALVDPKKQKAEMDMLNKRVWKLLDSVEGLMNFGIGAVQTPLQLTTLASALWRLNIGRPSILRPMCMQMLKLIDDGQPGVTAQEASMIASAAAHLSSKDIRQEQWMQDALFAAAEVVLKDPFAFEDKVAFVEVTLPVARSLTLTGHFHEAFFHRFFETVNSGLLESRKTTNQQTLSHGVIKSSQARIFHIHLDNLLMHRSPDAMLKPGEQQETYRASFVGYEKQQKNAQFRTRHLVASALESMELHPLALHPIAKDGYVVDIALSTQKIAIEINTEDAYLARDPRMEEDQRDSASDDSIPTHHPQLRFTLPFADLRARHLEHRGWIVVQLNADEFLEIQDQDKRAEYLSMLIEIATYSRAEELSTVESDGHYDQDAKRKS